MNNKNQFFLKVLVATFILSSGLLFSTKSAQADYLISYDSTSFVVTSLKINVAWNALGCGHDVLPYFAVNGSIRQYDYQDYCMAWVIHGNYCCLDTYCTKIDWTCVAKTAMSETLNFSANLQLGQNTLQMYSNDFMCDFCYCPYGSGWVCDGVYAKITFANGRVLYTNSNWDGYGRSVLDITSCGYPRYLETVSCTDCCQTVVRRIINVKLVNILTLTKAGTGSGTVTSSPSGINCGPLCSTASAAYATGTSVTLSATPSANSTFAGWSGDCSGTGTCTVSMTQDRNVTATFDPAPAFDFSLSNSGDISIQKPASGSNSGANTITATLLSGTTQSVAFSAPTNSGLPTGASGSFGTAFCSPTCNSTYTITINSSVATGTYPITLRAAPAAVIPLIRTTSFNLIVTAVPPSNQAPIAVATISKDGSNYTDSITVTKGVATPIYLSATGSSDPNGWTDSTNGVSSGGKCEWNSDLNQGTPTFERTIANPASPSACNISLGDLTFNDAPGTYIYQVLRITDKPGLQSNIDTVQVTVTAGSCPSGAVILAASSINVGQTTTASAPAGFTGGSFQSSNTTVASVSGSTVTGRNAGSATISGSGWTYTPNGATNCSLSGASLTVNAGNNPPSANNLSVTQPYYCAITWPSAIFSWRFTDPDGDTPQSAYQIQIDNESSFSDPHTLTTGKVTSISQSYATLSGILSWSTTYYWRLMVWDSKNASSTWISGPSFATPAHAYPVADNFTWAPLNPVAQEIVTFSPPTQPAGVVPSWSWNIPDVSYATGSSPTSKNPQVTFNSAGVHTVSLTVTDAPPHSSYSCLASQTLNLQLALPEWIEVPPF